MTLRVWMTLAVLLAGGSAPAQTATSSSRRPNVIIILADQLRWSALGCYGNPVVRSPNIDRLAAEGVRFTHAFTNLPVCSPARSVLLSGRYARSTGVLHNQDSEAQPDRPTNRSTTIAEVFAGTGYETALIGKWHLAPSPQRLGFAESLRPRMRHRYYCQTYYRNEREVYVHEGFGPHHETDAAVEYIRRKRSAPFFLYLAYGPPHMPVSELPDPYRTMYDPAKIPLRPNVFENGKPAYDERWFKIYMWDFQYYNHPETFPKKLPPGMDLRDLTALYYGQITMLDDCVGRVLSAIREAGMKEDTIVLFSADHGDQLGSHQAFNKNRLYDESIHVPMLVRYPRRIAPRVVDGQVASLVDVMPTLLDLCGLPIPQSVQGTSLARVLDDKATSAGENAAYFETTTGTDGVRTRRYVYAVVRTPGRPERESMFDVDEDPYEMHELAGDPEYQETQKELASRLQAWRDRTPRATATRP